MLCAFLTLSVAAIAFAWSATAGRTERDILKATIKQCLQNHGTVGVGLDGKYAGCLHKPADMTAYTVKYCNENNMRIKLTANGQFVSCTRYTE
jgi:hypothetical protein